MVSEVTAAAINRVVQLREAAAKRAQSALKATNNARLQAVKNVFASSEGIASRRFGGNNSDECSTETFSSSDDEHVPPRRSVGKRERDDGIALVEAARRRDTLRSMKEKSRSLTLSRLDEVIRMMEATIKKVGVISLEYRLSQSDDEDQVIHGKGNDSRAPGAASPQQNLKKNTPIKKTPNRKTPNGKGK